MPLLPREHGVKNQILFLDVESHTARAFSWPLPLREKNRTCSPHLPLPTCSHFPPQSHRPHPQQIQNNFCQLDPRKIPPPASTTAATQHHHHSYAAAPPHCSPSPPQSLFVSLSKDSKSSDTMVKNKNSAAKEMNQGPTLAQSRGPESTKSGRGACRRPGSHDQQCR
jgi:hypothetical protein